jgi:hypothetical protein
MPFGRIFSLSSGAALCSRSTPRRYFFFSFFGSSPMLRTTGNTL